MVDKEKTCFVKKHISVYIFIHYYLLTMHLGCPGSTNDPCFTIKDYMYRVRHVTYTIKIITHRDTGNKTYIIIKTKNSWKRTN
jgi:hypothetical protein